MADYKPVEIKINETDKQEPVHLDVLGMKLDLPNLNSTDLPIELVQMILILKSKPMLSDEETSQAMAVFLAYFQAMQPNFWNKLRLTDHAMEWLTGTVKAWAVESGIDPKALS
ncbi:MAG: hypothetical protein LKJ47_04795 [Bifidobacteriaceae bacterium]|jgi:hypothetical protein|nr:hypothetical protein [Bifidobacteriaceae bacterium]